VDAYVDHWITRIEDVTALAHDVAAAVREGNRGDAEALVPVERPYPLPQTIARQLGGVESAAVSER
jgi:hypothetical protein